LQNSPLESSCVVVALIENYSTSKPLKFSPEKSQILSCDTVVVNERYVHLLPASVVVFVTNHLTVSRVKSLSAHKELQDYSNIFWI